MPQFILTENFIEKNLVQRSVIIEAENRDEAMQIYSNEELDWDNYETIDCLDSYDYELENIEIYNPPREEPAYTYDYTDPIGTIRTYSYGMTVVATPSYCEYCGEDMKDCSCDKKEIENIESVIPAPELVNLVNPCQEVYIKEEDWCYH